MINEISQGVLGIASLQPKGGSGSVNRVQQQSSIESSKTVPSVKQAQVDPILSVQPAAVDEKEIEEVVDDLNELAQAVQRQLEFTVDEESGKTIVRVIDAETGETIRDIPPEEIINMQKHLRETSEQLFSGGDAGISLLFQGKT